MNKIIISLMVASVILASCGGVTPVPTVTPTLPATVLPTQTYTPSPTQTPLPTAILSQIRKIFTIPTRSYGLMDTPTPIATPLLDVSSAKLTEIKEEDAIHLINVMNEYSYRNFPSRGDWWTDGFFVSSQEPVAFAIQEYLYHFPESLNIVRLRWQLAFINAIMSGNLAGNPFGDEWMIEELQDRLNMGEVSPNQLEVVLDQYWFDVAYLQPVENLFDDGKTGWFYMVVPKVWEEDEISENQDYYGHGGLYIVVREVQSHEFQVFLLNSAWNFSFAASSVFDISDHNQNGRPEIALFIGSHSGTMCGGNLLIYEWNGNSFVELTQGIIQLGDCSESVQYSQYMNPPAITYSGIFPRRTELYLWNGDFYEFDRYADVTLFDVWRNSYRGSGFSYADEVKILSDMLTSGEADKYGPAYPDYLQYRLGIAYAFQSKHTEATSIFQDLVSKPSDPTRNVFPDMAQAFMEKYTGNASMYDACKHSLDVYEKALSDLNRENETELRQSILGFNFTSFNLYVFPLCDEGAAFSLSINSIPSSTKFLPAEMQKIGIDVIYSENLDINLDGKTEEWLVAIDPYNLFTVFPHDSYYEAKRLDATIEIDDSNNPTVEITIESWNGFSNSTMVIHSGQDFSILEIAEGYESKILLSDFSVMDYKISNQNNDPQVQIFHSKPNPSTYYPDHPWDGYRWDAQDHEFKNDLLEYYLFTLHNPKAASEIAEPLLSILNEWKQIPNLSSWPPLSYTYYIVGLSYELSGDQQRAAEIYWELWRDFPESHYALLAKYKLELANP